MGIGELAMKNVTAFGSETKDYAWHCIACNYEF